MDQTVDCIKNNSFASALGGTCAMNEHHGIDPNMSNSGHHDLSTKAVFLCTALLAQPQRNTDDY